MSNTNKEGVLLRYQSAIFTSLFVGYACYTYNRKSVSYALPALLTQGLLTKNGAGAIISCQNSAYAVSKFMGGVMSDKISARRLFTTGLFLSGVSTVLFSTTNNPVLWSVLWILNGFGQGAGWPACAKLLKKWYSPAKFGTMWSVLSGSSNVSGSLTPFIAAYLILNQNWQVSLLFAGYASIIMSIVALCILVDDPAHLSLPEQTLNSQPENEDCTETKSKKENIGKSTMSVSELLFSPFLWVVSFCALVVHCAKTALQDWGQLYLIDQLDRTQIQASSFISSIETGGFFGGIIAGIITDQMTKKMNTSGNPRLQVATVFLCGCVTGFHFLCFSVSKDTPQVMIALLGVVLGACLFGPVSIFGIVVSESFPSHLSGTAHAVAALSANVGAVCAGWPLSQLASAITWSGAFTVLEIAVSASLILILTTKSFHITSKTKLE